MSGPAPAAPVVFRLCANQVRFHALVVDYTKELDWVPELPTADSKVWTFSRDHGAYSLEWWPPTLPRFRFFLTFLGSHVHLVVQEYDYWMPVHHAAVSIPLDDLSRRGMLMPAGCVSSI